MNVERLLGHLVMSGIRGGGKSAGLGSKSMLGMGAIGVAVAAYEHFINESNTTVGGATTAAQTTPKSSGVTPPPLPSSDPMAPPPLPPSQEESLLLIRP